MQTTYLRLDELRVGMRTTVEALSQIADRYMILLYDRAGEKEGTLVYIGKRRTKEFSKWFFQNKPITPIHHTKEELSGEVYYDE